MKTKPTSIRIPEDMKNELDKISQRETRSISNLILVAIKEFIKQNKEK